VKSPKVGIKHLCFQNVNIFLFQTSNKNLFMLRCLSCSLINRQIQINTLLGVVLVKCFIILMFMDPSIVI